jgi:imidazolonepropionase-like amidohydrolase
MAGRFCTITPPAIRASLVALLALVPLAGCHRKPADGVALVGAAVFDGVSPYLKRDMVIVVRKDTIAAIGTRSQVQIPKDLPVVELDGKYVIPGLIDGHVHVQAWTLDRFVAEGVTAVRDVHGQLDTIMHLREQAQLNSYLSPRIYAAGAMIDGVPATYGDAFTVKDGVEARKAVDKLAVTGVDFVKVYTGLDEPLLRAVLDEAKTFGLKVTAHLGAVDAITAGEMGVWAIEHMSGVPEAAKADPKLDAAFRAGFFPGWTAFERAWAGLDSASLARVAQRLVAEQVTLIPTLVLHDTFSRLDDPALAADSALRAVPDSEIVRWNVPGMVRRAGWTQEDFTAFRAARANQDLFVRLYRAAGGRVVAGTDAANQMLIPGTSLHRELELLVAAGFLPIDALYSATRDAARLLAADSIGVLAVGRKADLVVLGADPVLDIVNLRSVERVMLRGHLLASDSLRKQY